MRSARRRIRVIWQTTNSSMPATPKLFSILHCPVGSRSAQADDSAWGGLQTLLGKLADKLAPEGHQDKEGFHLLSSGKPIASLPLNGPNCLGEHI